MYLKEKFEYLDSESKMLAEHVISNDVERAEKDDAIFDLKEEVKKFKILQENQLQELDKVNKSIKSLSVVVEEAKTNSFSVNKNHSSISEDLEMKDEQIKCLQEELVHVRLQQAEKWAVIRDLQQIKNEFEKETEILGSKQPETISRLQEQLMMAKLLETQQVVEFDNIKKQIAQMKLEFEQQKQGLNRDAKPEGSVKISKSGVKWLSKDRRAINELISKIEKLEKEKTYLNDRIPELLRKINTLNAQFLVKEAERCEVQEKLDNARLKQRSIESVTLERQKQCARLEENAIQKVTGIRTGSKEKKEDIEELVNKLNNADAEWDENQLVKLCETKELKIIESLEAKISALQNRIDQLNSEIATAN